MQSTINYPKLRFGKKYIDIFPYKPATQFKLAMFPQFMTSDPIHSYRLFYAGAKFRFAKWRINQPSWWNEYRALVKDQGLETVNDKDDGVKL